MESAEIGREKAALIQGRLTASPWAPLRAGEGEDGFENFLS